MTDMAKQPFVLATRTERTGTHWFIDAEGNWTTYSHEVATFPTEEAARLFRKDLTPGQRMTRIMRKWWSN